MTLICVKNGVQFLMIDGSSLWLWAQVGQRMDGKRTNLHPIGFQGDRNRNWRPCGAQVRGMLLLELMEGCVSNSGNALSHSFLFNLLKAGTLSYCCIHPFIWNWQFLRRDCEETVVDELSPLAKVPISSGEWCLLHEKPCLPSLPKEPEHSCHFLQDH